MAREDLVRRYAQTFEVEGSGEFPWDMLRYDGCFPAREEDSHTMAAARAPGTRTVRLVRYTPTDRPPTDSRWRSLGWDVNVAVRGVRDGACDLDLQDGSYAVIHRRFG